MVELVRVKLFTGGKVMLFGKKKNKNNGYRKYKIEFGQYKGDYFGTNNGYVKIGIDPDGNEYARCFKKENAFTPEQIERIYTEMRKVRLAGEELADLQPIPSLPLVTEDKVVYDVVSNANTWVKFRSKARDPRDIYCLTNKELVLHSKEINNFFKAQAESDMANIKKSSIGVYANSYIERLKNINQVLEDINAIFEKLGEDQITSILDEEYANGDKALAEDLFNSINSITLGLYNQAEIAKREEARDNRQK